MSIYFSQYRALLWKCFLINFRGREFLKEMISVVILAAFIIIAENFQPNNIITPFYIAIAIIGYTRYSAMSWVSEKETRQKELQKIMGMSSSVYLFGWLTYYILNGLMITCVMMLFLVVGVFSNGKTTIK